MGDYGNWSGTLYGDAIERWLAPEDQGDASDWYAGTEGGSGTRGGAADPDDERPIFVYNDFDIPLTYLHLVGLPPTPSPQCRVGWSTADVHAARCFVDVLSMFCADWGAAFGFAVSKLGASGTLRRRTRTPHSWRRRSTTPPGSVQTWCVAWLYTLDFTSARSHLHRMVSLDSSVDIH